MKTEWRFAGLKTGKGNVIRDFVSKDVGLQTRIEAFLRRLKVQQRWHTNDFDNSMGDGIGELRIDYQKVEQRLYGFFEPGMRFIVVIASSGKKRQQKTIQAAKALKREFDRGCHETEDYDV